MDFSVLFDSAPDIYLVLLPDAPKFTMVGANKARLRATNTQLEQILGRGIFEFFPDNPDDPNATGVRNLRLSLTRVVETRLPDTMAVQKYDIPKPDSEGGGYEERFWSPLNTPVLDESGAIQYIIHRVEDVTEFVRLKQMGTQQSKLTGELQARIERAESEVFTRAQEVQETSRKLRAAHADLEQLYARVKEVDEIKTRFFANVSHEFRTPLTLMVGPIDDLLQGRHGAISEVQKNQIELLQRNSLRLLKLVNSLLDFSRVEAQRAHAVFEPLDLPGFTTYLAGAFQSAVERAGMKLTVECEPLREPVYVDRELWEKIVLNLISNAFKYTLQGEINVSLKPIEGGVQFQVRDTGVGIPEAELPRLFQRFHRVHGTQGRTFEGTGIGLALAQELAKLHGGEIKAQSILGQGSSFTVTIPSGAAHLPADHVRHSAESTPTTGAQVQAFVGEVSSWLPRESPPCPAGSTRRPVHCGRQKESSSR